MKINLKTSFVLPFTVENNKRKKIMLNNKKLIFQSVMNY